MKPAIKWEDMKGQWQNHGVLIIDSASAAMTKGNTLIVYSMLQERKKRKKEKKERKKDNMLYIWSKLSARFEFTGLIPQCPVPI